MRVNLMNIKPNDPQEADLIIKPIEDYYLIVLNKINPKEDALYFRIKTDYESTTHYISIAHLLNIPFRDYYDIMMKNGACPVDQGGLIFQYITDAEKAFHELLPYIILNKLVGE